jgi:MYXO-CTERM domain-containing protein
MGSEQEMLTIGVVASGVLVVNAATPLQVIWLLVLGGVLIAFARRRRVDDFDGGDTGGGGLRRPPTGPRLRPA